MLAPSRPLHKRRSSPATQLSNGISEGRKKFINSPQVTVTLSEFNSRRVYVTGEAARAGAFPLLPIMTVLQALSEQRRLFTVREDEKHLCTAP
jgi:hypothetical protein